MKEEMNHIHKSMSRGSIAITIFIFFVTAYASIPITTEMYITVINILYRILLMRKLISLFLSSFSSTISSAVSDFERLLEIFTIPSVKTITFKTIDFTSMVLVINMVTNTIIESINSATQQKNFFYDISSL